MYQHLDEPPPPLPPSVPIGVRLQVEWLLATPEEPPANALQVRQALEAALQENMPEARLFSRSSKVLLLLSTERKRGREPVVPVVVEQETVVPARCYSLPQ